MQHLDVALGLYFWGITNGMLTAQNNKSICGSRGFHNFDTYETIAGS